jgi:hypothetical protein
MRRNEWEQKEDRAVKTNTDDDRRICFKIL